MLQYTFADVNKNISLKMASQQKKGVLGVVNKKMQTQMQTQNEIHSTIFSDKILKRFFSKLARKWSPVDFVLRLRLSGQAQISTWVFDSLESYAECVRQVAARSLY